MTMSSQVWERVVRIKNRETLPGRLLVLHYVFMRVSEP